MGNSTKSAFNFLATFIGLYVLLLFLLGASIQFSDKWFYESCVMGSNPLCHPYKQAVSYGWMALIPIAVLAASVVVAIANRNNEA
jgi:hypothetical protein